MFSLTHLHPMLVHFPIALIMVGFLAELIYLFYKKEVCLTKVGFYLLILGTLAACAAVLSGFLFTDNMAGAAGQIKETHELCALLTVIFALVISAIRIYLMMQKTEKPGLNKLAFVFYGITAIAVSATGFFGGNLVYNYMMPL